MFLWLTIITVILGWTVYWFRQRRTYELLSRLPMTGDELPVIGIAHKLIGNSENAMELIKKYSTKVVENGGISYSWAGPMRFIGVADPVDLEFILKTCLEKSDIHKFTRAVLGNGMIFAPVQIWRRRRKVVIPTFSPKIVESFVKVFSERAEKMAKKLDRYAGTGPLKLWPFISSYALDSVAETTMGVKIDALENSNTPFLIALNRLLELVCMRIFHLYMYPDWLYKLLPQYRDFKYHLKNLYGFTDEVIKKKRSEMENLPEIEPESKPFGVGGNKTKSFLDHLMIMSGGKDGFNNLELREELLTLAVAGTDTSAVATGYTLVLLGKYPHIQEKVYQELYEIFGDSDRPLEKEDLVKMQYLDRVVKESLRLFPPAPVSARESADTELTLPSGRVLPPKEILIVFIGALHRDPKYWGPNAEEFDPDRFLPERFKLDHACSYMPFSQGPRACVGYQYAMYSIKTAVSSMVRRYKIIGKVETSPIPKIRVKLEIMMKDVDEYTVALERRKPQ